MFQVGRNKVLLFGRAGLRASESVYLELDLEATGAWYFVVSTTRTHGQSHRAR